MHEVSLVADLISACERHAAGRPVGLIRIRHASSLPEESLRQAFSMLTAGGPMASAILETEPFAVPMHCPCGFSDTLGHDDVISSSLAVCPSCGDLGARQRTAEIEVLEVRTSASTADPRNADPSARAALPARRAAVGRS